MKTPIYKNLLFISAIVLAFVLLPACVFAQAQPGSPLSLPGDKKKDDSLAFNKSNTDDWTTSNARISYKLLNSDKERHIDTSIHTFHRKRFSQPWNVNLGNFGTPARSLYFTPETRLGPTLGYHVFDIYRYDMDSLQYFNTNIPYSTFTFNLGSKLEQFVSVMHTQNIKPNWNFAAEYHKVNSPGYYQLQRSNHDNAYLTTNYQSINRRYKLYAGIVYNKEQQDENGGIVSDTFLTNSNFNDRRTIDVRFFDPNYGQTSTIPRSPITNHYRDYGVLLKHSYTWGSTDTLFNEDSTNMSMEVTPRFSISHEFRLSNEQHTYKDLRPDSLRYIQFFSNSFLGGGDDSLFSRQRRRMIDNTVLLNGFFGQRSKQVQFSAGTGLQLDKFGTYFLEGAVFSNITSNYLVGQIKKEAYEAGQWFYQADAKFYVAGAATGNSLISLVAGRELKNDIATISAGISQNINNAPYNYTLYISQYDTIAASFNKESITSVFASIHSNRFKFNLTARNKLINNYIYLNATQLPDQYASTFSLLQVSLQKQFSWKGVVLDNEIVYQQKTTGAPINVPQFMGRHQLSYERGVFKNALKIAVGAQIRYHNPYKPAGYSPFFNRYYYQDSFQVINEPVLAGFFNFRIKQFRAFVMVDQLQQIYARNFISAEGYPAQNTMIRFGFTWVLLK